MKRKNMTEVPRHSISIINITKHSKGQRSVVITQLFPDAPRIFAETPHGQPSAYIARFSVIEVSSEDWQAFRGISITVSAIYLLVCLHAREVR